LLYCVISKRTLPNFLQQRPTVLYGSRAKGNYPPTSDIDLTLLGENLNLSVLLEKENELDDLLLPYTIDCSIYRHIVNPSLLAHIERVGKVFYTRDIAIAESKNILSPIA
jgi:predicted nucleotidyltransferase